MAGVSLQDRGWYLSEEGITQCTQNGKSDSDSIIKEALNTDLREIGKGWLPEEMNRGKADYVQGPGVLQLQKIRNVSAPKDNEESQGAPRLMKLSLTDGQITCSAVETEVLNGISTNTPPGSKILLKMTTDVEHGFLLLNNKNTKHLGGRVEKLAEGWELKKKLAKQQRTTFTTDGGPPLFVPFGQRISTDTYKPTRRDNFRSLEVSKGETKTTKAEEDEFEQQRKATIAEALQAKEDGQARKFGGGSKVSDQDVAKIMEMGFQADDAVSALKQNAGNFQQALDMLLKQGSRGFDRNMGGGARQTSYESERGDRGRGRRDRNDDEPRGGPRGGRRGREEDTGDVGSKPSGPATLFDFLNTKISVGESKAADSKPASKTQSSDTYVAKEPRERTRNNSDHSNYSKQSDSHSVPPRFSNKAKQQDNYHSNYPNQNSRSGGQGRYYDDRSERSRGDDRPKSGQNDNRNFSDKRNYSSGGGGGGKNYSDRNYGERSERTRNRGEGAYSDRQYNEGDGGGRRGAGRDDYNRDYKQQSERRNYTDNQKSANSSKSSASTSQRQLDSKSGYGNKERESSRAYNDQKPNNRGDARVTDYNSRNIADKNDTSRSRNYQNGQNSRQDTMTYKQNQNSQSVKQESYTKADNYRESQSTKGSNSRQQNSSYGQSYPATTSGYSNYNNTNVVNTSGGQYQQSPEYMYTESGGGGGSFSIQPGDKIMAKYWEDGMYYDAQVDVIGPGMPTCVVTFTEYGNTEEVLLQDIRPVLPQMIPSHQAAIMAPDLSVPPPQMFYSAPPPQQVSTPAGLEDVIHGIGTMEFRRGGGGQHYARKDNGRPQQQYYQPPASRR